MKRSLKYYLSIVVVVLNFCTPLLAENSKAYLNYPGITAGFCIQRPGFWTNTEPATATLRLAMINMLDSSKYLGLNNSRYHLSNIRELTNDPLGNTGNAALLEEYLTDALVTYCMDMVKAPAIKEWLWYDEVGEKYDKKIKEKLLAELLTIRSLNDIRQLVRSVQPSVKDYQLLLEELKNQIAEQNTLNIKKLKMSLAYYRWAHFYNFPKLILVT